MDQKGSMKRRLILTDRPRLMRVLRTRGVGNASMERLVSNWCNPKQG